MSEDTTPTYPYYIIGIGNAVLIIILVLVICYRIYKHRVKRNNATKLYDPQRPLFSVSDYYSI